MNLRRFRSSGRAAAVALLAAAVAAGCQKPKAAPPAARPVEVVVTRPQAEEVTDFEEFTGRAGAVQTVEIRARVTGYLQDIKFKDGDDIKKGQVLYDIDPRPYKAALDKAEALVAQAKARQKRTEADYRRSSALFARGTVSREEYDLVIDNAAEARAAVGVAVADRDVAALNLEWTKVASPLDGRISRTQVDRGNLVKADETLLTTVVALNPIRAYFEIDERTLLRIRRLVREGRVQSRTEADVAVLVALADEPDYSREGKIDFSDNQVDPSTGTLQVRGVIPNPPPYVLSPGLFVRVRLPVGKPHRVLTIDEQAISTDQGRKFVYVVDPKNKVAYRRVEIGALNEGRRVIEEGLEPGDRVIVSGMQRVRPGAEVVPQEAEDQEATSPGGVAEARAEGDEEPGPAATGRTPSGG